MLWLFRQQSLGDSDAASRFQKLLSRWLLYPKTSKMKEFAHSENKLACKKVSTWLSIAGYLSIVVSCSAEDPYSSESVCPNTQPTTPVVWNYLSVITTVGMQIGHF
jgi:hypothetical protein